MVFNGQFHVTNSNKPQPSTSLLNVHCVSSTLSLMFLHSGVGGGAVGDAGRL